MNKYSINLKKDNDLGRNKELNDLMKDERKAQIFDSALKLFAIKGLAATKISDIAKDANFSQGLIYHYFKSKDDIFVALIKNAFHNLVNACIELDKMEMEPLDKLGFAYSELIKIWMEKESAARNHLLIANATISDSIPIEAKKIIDANYRIPYEILQKIIENGQENGTIIIKDSKELSMMFWATLNGLAIYRSVHGSEFVKPDVEIFLQMFKNKDNK